MDSDPTIRRAKLLRPRLAAGLVSRPRLVDLLDRALAYPVILVAAPAGFGKTTALGEWLASTRIDSAWVTLDAEDGEPARFVAHVAAALRTVRPDLVQTVLDLLAHPEVKPAALGAALGDELLDLPDDLILVLDDFHEVTNPRVHDLLTALVQYPPAALHLVLSSRADPPLPLARLRGRGQLAEIRAADLRFTDEEARALLAETVQGEVDAETVALLQERTEGWVAGLRLASLMVRGQADGPRLADSFAASGHRHIMDFLLDEVLGRQPAPIQDFLLRASLVDRVCGSLADALLSDGAQPGTGHWQLDQLARHSLYVEPVGDDAVWFRFHPLIRGLLRRRLEQELSEEGVAALHRRASAWFASHDLIDDAIDHALSGQDAAAAAAIVERQTEDALAREDWRTLQRWLLRLPDDLIRTHPPILLTRARIARMSGHFAGARLVLAEIDALLARGVVADETERRSIADQAASLSLGTLKLDANVAPMLALAEDLLARLPPDDRLERGHALFWLSVALQASGRLPEATVHVNRALVEDVGRIHSGALLALFGLAFAHHREGELADAAQLADQMLRLASQADLEVSLVRAHRLLATLAYDRNDLDAAIAHASAVVARRELAPVLMLYDSMLQLALAQQATGDEAAADATIASLLETLLQTNNRELLPSVRAFQARLALLRGDVSGASHWLATPGVTIDNNNLGAVEVQLWTRAKVLLAVDSDDALAEAGRHLEELIERANAVHCWLQHVDFLALRALWWQKQGQTAAALDDLSRAVDFGVPRGFVRCFLDLGADMAELLRRLAERDPSPFPSQILAAFEPAGQQRDVVLRQVPAGRPAAIAGPKAHILDLLTEREVDVFVRLQRRLSNKEIAEEMFISPLTVKRHTSNIYDKLGVSSRRQLVVLAESLTLPSSY